MRSTLLLNNTSNFEKKKQQINDRNSFQKNIYMCGMIIEL